MTARMQSAATHVIIRARDVWKSYDQGTIAVLNGVDLEASKGEVRTPCRVRGILLD